MSIQIQTVQSTTTLGIDTIDVKFISENFPNTKYDERVPHKVTIFLEHPKTRIDIFSKKSKLLVLGGKTTEDASDAVNALVNMLFFYGHEHGIFELMSVEYYPPIVHNISSSGDLHSRVDLPAFHNKHHTQCQFDTCQFPGLRYKPLLEDTNISATVFHSGKYIVGGCKSDAQVQAAYQKLLYLASPFMIDKNL